MEVVASLSQGRTAAAQCGLFTHKSVPVMFEPRCNCRFTCIAIIFCESTCTVLAVSTACNTVKHNAMTRIKLIFILIGERIFCFQEILQLRQIFAALFFPFTFMLPCIVIDFILNNQPDALIIPVLFCYKTLHVSGILSVHHQEFSTVHSALVNFMQVSYDRFQAESGWNAVPS